MLLCPIIGEVTFDQLVKVTVYVEEEDQKVFGFGERTSRIVFLIVNCCKLVSTGINYFKITEKVNQSDLRGCHHEFLS